MSGAQDGPVRLLGLSGSIRHRSYCTAVLRTIEDAIRPEAEMEVFGLETVPPYNEDLEGDEEPEIVRALKRAIVECDGLVVISPEYNHGMSGVLKNAIDWVSRPGYKSVLKDKPVLVMTAAPSALGGARAQVQLRETFASTLSRVIARRQVVIGEVGKKVSEGRLVHQDTLTFVLNAIDELLEEIGLVQGRAPIRLASRQPTVS